MHYEYRDVLGPCIAGCFRSIEPTSRSSGRARLKRRPGSTAARTCRRHYLSLSTLPVAAFSTASCSSTSSVTYAIDLSWEEERLKRTCWLMLCGDVAVVQASGLDDCLPGELKAQISHRAEIPTLAAAASSPDAPRRSRRGDGHVPTAVVVV